MHAPLLVLTLVSSMTTSLVSQAPIDSVAARLRPPVMVRVKTDDGRRIESPLRAVQASPSVLTLEAAPSPVAGRAIDTLWVRSHSAGLGAITGAAIGGLGGMLLIGATCGGTGSEMCDGSSQYMVGAGLAGGACGALLGALIGSAIPRWREVYVRPAMTPRPGGSAMAVLVHLNGW